MSARADAAPAGTCRLCGAPARTWAARPDLRLYRCPRCAFVTGRPSAERAAAEHYADYYHDAVLQAPMPEARYREWLALAERRLRGGAGRLLEVGAGSGGFVRAALARGWHVDATEVSASGLVHLRASAARVFAGELHAASYPEASFDLVVALEVLEHLPDPGGCLRELRRVLRPGGLALLTTPSFAGLSRRVLGLGWRVLDPEHLGYFTPATLRAALRAAGFTQVQVRARGLDVTAWRRGRDGRPARFDPQASAALRERVERRGALRVARQAAHALLGLTGLGDSLLAWARR